MNKLYILKKEDFEGDLLEELSELNSDSILYIYGNRKNLGVGQKQKIKEISEVSKVDFKHFTNDGLLSIVNDLFEKYKEVLMENQYLLLGEKSKAELEDLLQKGIKSIKKNHKNNKKNQYPSVCGSIDCTTIQKGNSKADFDKKNIDEDSNKENVKQESKVEKDKNTESAHDKSKKNRISNKQDTEKKESNDINQEETDSKHELQKADKAIPMPPKVNKKQNEPKTERNNTHIKKTEKKDEVFYTFDSNAMGKITEKKLFPPPRRTNTTNSEHLNTHKKKEVTKEELENNIQQRKKLEKEIFGTDPTIAPKEEVIDIGLEIRVEFLISRLRYITEEIEKIIKRCKVSDYPVTNDVAFKWIINVLQTASLEDFNNQNRIDINLNEQEYEKICKLANNYNKLCGDIYEEDDW